MSEYKTIHGIHVQALDTDPSNLGSGQVWYNTTSNQLKITAVSTSGAWATGGNLGTTRQGLAGAGTQTAALGFGGRISGSTPDSTATEHYDGSAWTAGGNMATTRYKLAGAGTQTSGLAFGGGSPTTNATEHYDGSAWTSGGNLGTAKYYLAGAGTQTAGLAFGGGFPISNTTEHYDGSAWTAGGNMATTRYSLGGAGTLSAGLGFGGYADDKVNATEEYAGPGIISKTVTSS